MPAKLTLTALITSLVLAGPVSAASFLLTAESSFPAQYSGFSITFDDLDGDQTLSIDEVLDFSGITSFQFGQTYTELTRVPVVADIADGVILTFSSGLTSNSWAFREGAAFATSISAASFRYDLSPLVVPLPASGLGLLAGLGALLLLRRR